MQGSLRRSRRAIIAAGLGGLGAAMAHAAGRPEHAQAAHDGTNVLHLGEDNVSPGGGDTAITNGLFMTQGLLSSRSGSSGVEGGGDPGVWGASDAGRGVIGTSWDGGGVVGAGGSRQADPLPRPPGPGVIGFALGDAPGVQALSASDTGLADPLLDCGLALEVIGTSRFSTAGAGVIRRGRNADFIDDAAVTAQSHISVTLTDDPGARQVRWVERVPGSGFRVHLSPPTSGGRPRTALTYLIVEPVT